MKLVEVSIECQSEAVDIPHASLRDVLDYPIGRKAKLFQSLSLANR